MHTPCKPLFDGHQVFLRNTPKPVTRFGRLVVFIEFLQRISYQAQAQALIFPAPYDGGYVKQNAGHF